MNFERGKDPKEALEIGIFSRRYFNKMSEAKTWVIQNHVAILGLKSLCDPFPTPEQFSKLKEYVREYIHYSDSETWPEDNIVDGVAQLYRELHEVRNTMKRVIIR